MVNMSLVVGGNGVLFSPPLEETKEIMINCLKEIVENTQEFPRIEKEIFPDYKDEDLFLLEVTWEEDYVQTLGRTESSGLDTHIMLVISVRGRNESQLYKKLGYTQRCFRFIVKL